MEPQQQTLPVHGQDVFNYLAQAYASNHQLHMVLTFDEHLNDEIVAKAIRLTMNLEPVLGCRFFEQSQSPSWVRRTDLDELDLCPVQHTADPHAAVRDFVALPTDSRKDPLIQAKVFRAPAGDTLCLKMDHACVDGGGLKAYTYLLAEIYSNLCAGRSYSGLHPSERCSGAPFLRQFGIEDPREAWDPSQMAPPPAWGFPCRSHHNQAPAFALNQLTSQQFAALKAYARTRSVTINDLLLTAYYRALFKVVDLPDGRSGSVALTVDLRRRVPEGSRIVTNNFSSSFDVLLPEIPEESFAGTLTRVAQATSTLKAGHGEVPIAVVLELFGYMAFSDAKAWFVQARQQAIKTGLSTPHLSNLGVIDAVAFGEHAAVEGYAVTPAMFGPGLMLGASTYNDILTLVVHYYTTDIDRELVETLLRHMVDDLTGLDLLLPAAEA